MTTQSDLRKLQEYIAKSIKDWDDRTGRTNNPPYKADTPCYYCQFAGHYPRDLPDLSIKACNYCIHNPDAVIYKVEP